MKKKNAVEFSPSELKNQKLKLKQVKKLDKIVVAFAIHKNNCVFYSRSLYTVNKNHSGFFKVFS